MIYFIKNKGTHWGDWSNILWSGFAPLDEEKNCHYIEGSGPFVPPIFEAGGRFIFTEAAKKKFESSPLTSLEFLYELEKRKIVNVDWTAWDKDKDYYDYYDNIFEPEDFIYNLPHDPEIAKAMPALWLTHIVEKVNITIDRSVEGGDPSTYLSTPYIPPPEWDFMKGIGYGGYFVSERAKDWLTLFYPECFDFFPIDVKIPAETQKT